jgi:hypothetical protein
VKRRTRRRRPSVREKKTTNIENIEQVSIQFTALFVTPSPPAPARWSSPPPARFPAALRAR